MDMIEKVREALRRALEDRAWHDSTPGDAEICIDGSVDLTRLARAAIKAMKEPTEEMVEAGVGAFTNIRDIYDAMIDAALSPRTSPQAPSSE